MQKLKGKSPILLRFHGLSIGAYLLLQEAFEHVYFVLVAALASLHRKYVSKDRRTSLTLPVRVQVGLTKKTHVNLVELILPGA